MEREDDWNRFVASGKVEDYLEYKGCVDLGVNSTDVIPNQETAGGVLLVDTDPEKKKSILKEKDR